MFRLPIVIFGALAIAIASLLVARAADAADDQFVNSLAAQGITGDRGTIIAAGHTVCDDVARVASTAPGLGSKTAQLVDVINGLRVAPYQTAFVISTAKSIYCPQYLGVRV
jgi:Protein of unknown function (DUF732)